MWSFRAGTEDRYLTGVFPHLRTVVHHVRLQGVRSKPSTLRGVIDSGAVRTNVVTLRFLDTIMPWPGINGLRVFRMYAASAELVTLLIELAVKSKG